MDNQTLTEVPGKTPAGGTPLPRQATADDLSGTTLGGYRLVRKIAQGGMGVVYEAVQTKLDRRVALKLLTEPLALRPEFLQRFEREAKAAAALNHTNLVQVHDFGEVARRHFIIMEYVEGEDLTTVIAQRGKMSVNEALDVVEQAARALRAAAEKSIIHRDIKPSNLILAKNGQVKLADLGLAKILTQESDLTFSSISMGSPHFMAPEQAENSRFVDHRVDIYSLGITLLYLVTGKYAHQGTSPLSIVLAHAQKPLPRGRDLGTELPAPVEALIRKMAAKDPANRYPNYDALLADIQCVRQGNAPAPVVPDPPAGRFNSRRIALFSLPLLVVVTALAAAIYVHERETAAPGAPTPGAPPDRTPEFADRSQFRPPDGPPGGMEDGPPGGGFPMPMGPPPMPELFPVTGMTVPEMLMAADDYAAKNRTNFFNIEMRYRIVRQQAAGSSVEAEIGKRLSELNSKLAAAREDVIKRYQKRMAPLLEAGKFQEAFDAWRDFPGSLRSRETDQEIRQVLRQSFPPEFMPAGPDR